ncbi:MAG: hypothetical protein I8H72_03415 [Myxococcaceae bacterium]|nr:hypothetical protein [Myxococcaceae bacterium]
MLMASACTCQSPPLQPTLVFTTNFNGWVEPCGCTADPLGGIARLATLLKQYPKAWWIDAGNTLNDPTAQEACPDAEKSDLLLKTLKTLGCRGTVLKVGEAKSMFASAGIPILSSSGFAVIEPRPGLKVGIANISRKELEAKNSEWAKLSLVIWGQAPGSELYPPFRLGPKGPFVFSAGSQGQHLGVLEIVNWKTGVAAPLDLDDSKSQRDQEVMLLKNRIDSLQKMPHSEFIKNRIQLAKSELSTIQKKPLKRPEGPFIRFQAIPIRKEIKPDPQIAKSLKAYEDNLPKRLAACESGIQCPTLKTGEASYVGAESCKTCHSAAYEFWKKAVVEVTGKDEQGRIIKTLSGHSVAWKTLQDKNKALDRNCIGCHSVGFMKPGGYCKAEEVDFRGDVQCESCHGPGSLHAQDGDKSKIQKSVPESHCRSCHHVPHIPSEQSFVYRDKLKVILGPGHGESLLLKLNK